MGESFNIYCDESCHLENDSCPVMVIGAVWCPTDKSHEIAERIREIKVKHGLSRDFEIKWTKVSPGGKRFYQELIDYFFDNSDLHFRGVVIPKAELHHEDFGQDHDTWYYKMYFVLLEILLSPDCRYNIYLDIKDTRSQGKVQHLREVLCNNMFDFDRKVIHRVQQVRSHEVEQIQLADLLIGALGHLMNRGVSGSLAKQELISLIKHRSDYSLNRTTLVGEKKLNLLHWRPKGQANG